eukprot:2683265-Amphidinium_carterae.1
MEIIGHGALIGQARLSAEAGKSAAVGKLDWDQVRSSTVHMNNRGAAERVLCEHVRTVVNECLP